jgi:hypothetical protein
VVLTLGTQSANVNSAGFQLLYSNNFINNEQILSVPIGGPFVSNVIPLSPAGQWDNGSVGNYWSNYLSRYPNATELDHSGIGDTPYAIIDSTTYSDDYANGTTITGTAILGTAVDRYPVMVPFSALIAPNSISTVSPSLSHPPTVTPPYATPESFQTVTVAAISMALAVVTIAGLLVYFKKRKGQE